MLESVITKETMRDGFRRFFREFSDADAEPKDLWDAIEEASRENPPEWDGLNRNLNCITSNWVSQAGYPIVTIKRDDHSQLLFQQKRFFMLPEQRQKLME
ncbi:aminopeptidase N [Elysia marginata]|uniref:Aminopeptidase N n=1 Tax=Elysia marginata TaxID=1093978 RepID=A0AAV4EJ37_9GAST|nr:aminopeptidase N [Elysia marginata]